MDFFTWENLQTLTIPKGIPKLIQNTAILKDSFFFILENSLQLVNRKSGTSKTLSFALPVTQVSANLSSVLLLAEGTVWSMGLDESRSGVLGLPNVFKSDHPLKLDSLPAHVTKIALGPTHAACIDETGQLYTWGTGVKGELGDLSNRLSNPLQVPNFFKSVEVTCGVGLTAVCTEAGFLLIYGQRLNCSNCKKCSSFPVTLKSLSDDFVTKVSSVGENLVVQTDRNELKVVKQCFCVQSLGFKGKITEFGTFASGVVGLAADRRTVYVVKKSQSGWSCENFLVGPGEVSKIVSGIDSSIGLLGRGLKGIKKVSEIFSGDSSMSTTERVSFEEIAQSCGFKGKIGPIDQIEICVCMEKLALRKCLDAFISLKGCKKRRSNAVVVLSNKLIVKTVEKYWSTWKSITDGYRKARNVYETKIKTFQSAFLQRILKNLYFSSIKTTFLTILPKHLQLRSKLFLTLFKLITAKKQVLSLCRSFNKLKHIKAQRPSQLFIDPRYKIEIIPAGEDKDQDQMSPARNNSFLSDDPALTRFCTSPVENSKSEMEQKLSTSMKILSSCSSPLIEPLSSNESSPSLKQTKDDSSLRSQLSKKIGEKNALNIKIGAHTERVLPKSPSMMKKQALDKKKHFSNKELGSPRILSKGSVEGFAKRGSTTNIELISKHSQKLFQSFLTKCIKSKILAVIETIKGESRKVLGTGSKSVGSYGSPKTQALAGSWKNKLLALGMSKFIKVLSGQIKKNLLVGFVTVRSVRRMSL